MEGVKNLYFLRWVQLKFNFFFIKLKIQNTTQVPRSILQKLMKYMQFVLSNKSRQARVEYKNGICIASTKFKGSLIERVYINLQKHKVGRTSSHTTRVLPTATL